MGGQQPLPGQQQQPQQQQQQQQQPTPLGPASAGGQTAALLLQNGGYQMVHVRAPSAVNPAAVQYVVTSLPQQFQDAAAAAAALMGQQQHAPLHYGWFGRLPPLAVDISAV